MALDPFMLVLVVDAHGATAQILHSLLRQVGFVDIDVATTGAEALTKMRLKRYGMVISEWQLEPMTGNELLREMRSDPGLKRIPFIAIGEPNPENVIAAKKAGASTYIVKPFDAQTLKAKIEVAFATRAAPLSERQPVSTVTEPPQLSEVSGVSPKRFSGRFTGSS